ncbi:hypothetical protein MAIT1_03594 [Magnetofaba australis IT-1]|uniref:DUF302 domain-containing protein n=1 Tax=Magnetofaba australis IT-1 TaxID=1434232 RepID=A0A1Y2K704_9PROT|nr:hypothetical protein MAIT1_03594 [Magnetofaba australis IT-1]
MATLLPCNVVVRELPEHGVEVAAMDPLAMTRLLHDPAIAEVAREAAERLTRALAAIASRREAGTELEERS